MKSRCTEIISLPERMRQNEWWGGEYRPLKELLAEMAEVRAKNSHAD